MAGDRIQTRGSVDLTKEENQVLKIVEKLLSNETFIEKLTTIIDKNMCLAFETKMKLYDDKIQHLETQLQKSVNENNLYLDRLEQYTRINSLRIYGIPEVPTEKTDEVVTKMCKEKLDLDIPVSSMDCCHRLAGKEGQHRPIIVKFISRNTKKVILNNKRKLKNTKIVIREDLTRRRAQLLRNAAARFGHRSVWSNDGNVMVKMNSRIRKIVSEDDLRQMDLSCA
ncbi:hypothetical protein QE152_g15821 [Popillia japonica]|uniref:Uncharacterized protein n=1 Tax=Popillia japonica TaxID=7064 RepID=A0AAW1L712_POPJA